MARRAATVLFVTLALAAAACSEDGSTPDGVAGATTSAAPTTTTTTTDPAPTTTTTEPAPIGDLRVATINLLHGLDGLVCPEGLDHCRAPTRLAMLWDLVEAETGCPDIVALQEIGPRQQELVPATLGELCGGRYTALGEDIPEIPDQEIILTSLPVLAEELVDISGLPWTGHWAQLDSALGVVDVFATHYASSAYNPDCTAELCAPSCPAGIEMGSCNAIETAEFLDERAADGSLRLILGDLNKEIGDPRIRILTDAGYADVWTLAGNPECDPVTGTGCTCCVEGDGDLAGLDVAEQVFRSRIDFVLVAAPDGCAIAVDSPADADGDGTATGPWASTPASEAVDGLYWAADHGGVQADLSCRPAVGM